MQYNGNGYEFYMESGVKITFTERDLINFRLEMAVAGKEVNSLMSSVKEQSRSERPISDRSKRKQKPKYQIIKKDKR